MGLRGLNLRGAQNITERRRPAAEYKIEACPKKQVVFEAHEMRKLSWKPGSLPHRWALGTLSGL